MVFEAILFLSVLILAAKLFGELFHRINQPTLLGNVIAGIVVGPALFALVEPIDEIELFISIGVFFLFFLIGLEEIDIPGLFRVIRRKIFAGAGIAFLVPFGAASAFGIVTDMAFIQAFAIGSVVGASSLGVTAKILTDLGKLRSTLGLEIFTVTALVEFIAIILVSVFIQMNESESLPEVADIVWVFAKMIIFFGIAGSFSIFVMPHLLRGIQKYLKVTQIYFGTVIGAVLLVAYFAELSGIHGAIGALLLGIAVSRMPRHEYVEISKGFHTVGYGIFIPIFFAGIGLHFVPNFFDIAIWIIAGFLVIIIGVKFLGSFIAAKFSKLYPPRAVAYGIMSKGAVDLALMLSLLESEMLDEKLFSLLVFGTLLMMVVSSVMLQKSIRKYAQIKVGTTELGLTPIYVRRALSNYKAKQIMSKDFVKVPQTMSISDYLEKFEDATEASHLVFEDEQLVGVISYKEINKLHKNLWETATVGQIMEHSVPQVSPEEYLFSVVQKINSRHFDLVPVVDDIKVIGVIHSSNVMDLLMKIEE